MTELKLSVYPPVCPCALSAEQLQQTAKESLSNSITVVGLVSGSVAPDCPSNCFNEGRKFDSKSAVRNE